MTELATIGHNGPPDPLDEATGAFEGTRIEAETWLDGKKVENEGQMKAVDDLTKGMKEAKKAVEDAKELEFRPHKQAADGVIAKYKPTLEDSDRIIKGLVAIVSDFKAKLAAKKEAERKAAWDAARKAEREAEELAVKADVGNIDDQRAADAAKQSALDAQKAASAAQKDTVKGMRTVTSHEVVDMRALINWIATNDKPAIAEFASEYARKNGANIPDAIVLTVKTKEAY